MPDQDCHFTPISALNATDFRRRLRREKIAARRALSVREHAAASRRINDHLCNWLLAQPPGIVAFCAAVRAEVDCQPAILRLIKAGWGAAMPVVTAPATPMTFRPWSSTTPLTVDRHGIPVPDNTSLATPTAVLLPLVAFDAAGYRLGYGGGYFDRTLAACDPQPLTIGIGFDLCAIETLYPAEHDIPLDVVITESGLRNFRTSV